LDDTNSQRGLPPHDEAELLIKLRAWLVVLEDIPDYALAHCFAVAVKYHEPQHPFQSSEVAKIWREMSESTRQQLFEKSGIQALPAGVCEWCNNAGLMRLKVENGSAVAVKWNSSEVTNTVTKCDCRKA
jgi:hypothetical protein